MKHRRYNKTSKRSGNTVVALFIGILLGLGVALTIALYINFSQLPFLTKVVGHIVSNNQAKNNPTPARLVQGVDVLGGRSFPSDEDDNEELDYGTAAPVEHINFYENKNKTYKEEPVVDSNNDGDNNKDTSDQPNTIKNGETAPLEDTANDTNTAQESYDGTNHTFYVLIGSFRSVEKADSIRTRLALTGIHSSIHSEIDQSSQTIVHQLRIGPFPYQKQAEDAQKQLKLSGLVAKVIAY